MCLFLRILTLWVQPGLSCYLGTSFAGFSPRLLFPLPYFTILKLTELSLLSSQYPKQVIHVVAEPKRRELQMLEQHSGKQREKRDERREEKKERLVLKFVSLVPSYFFSPELG